MRTDSKSEIEGRSENLVYIECVFNQSTAAYMNHYVGMSVMISFLDFSSASKHRKSFKVKNKKKKKAQQIE